MEKNEGTIDRMFRIVIGVLGIIFSFVFLAGWIQIILLVLSFVVIGTGIVGYCGLYTLLGISTCPINPTKDSLDKKK